MFLGMEMKSWAFEHRFLSLVILCSVISPKVTKSILLSLLYSPISVSNLYSISSELPCEFLKINYFAVFI